MDSEGLIDDLFKKMLAYPNEYFNRYNINQPLKLDITLLVTTESSKFNRKS